MKTIEIDDDVFAALEKRIANFGDTPNTILRRDYLGSGASPSAHASAVSPRAAGDGHTSSSALLQALAEPKFQALGRGLERFLAILSYLYRAHSEKFEGVLSLPLGGRKYFGKSENEILAAANGNINAKQIPGSPFWVMTTFSNDDKKKIVRRVMHYLGYGAEETQRTLREMPDSKGRPTFDLNNIL